MPPRDLDSIEDMLQASILIQKFLDGITQEEFLNDAMRQAAVVREIEIIGEAARRISDQFRVMHQQIPWSQIIGMRNILIHAYDHVDPIAVWEATQSSIPKLIRQLISISPST